MLWCRLDDLVARNVGCSLCHACGMPLSSNGCRTATKFLLLLSATLRGICNKSRSVSLSTQTRAERNLRDVTVSSTFGGMCSCVCMRRRARASVRCCAGACWDARLKAHFIHLKGHSDQTSSHMTLGSDGTLTATHPAGGGGDPDQRSLPRGLVPVCGTAPRGARSCEHSQPARGARSTSGPRVGSHRNRSAHTRQSVRLRSGRL
jgi:hypothetical protein